MTNKIKNYETVVSQFHLNACENAYNVWVEMHIIECNVPLIILNQSRIMSGFSFNSCIHKHIQSICLHFRSEKKSFESKWAVLFVSIQNFNYSTLYSFPKSSFPIYYNNSWVNRTLYKIYGFRIIRFLMHKTLYDVMYTIVSDANLLFSHILWRMVCGVWCTI